MSGRGRGLHQSSGGGRGGRGGFGYDSGRGGGRGRQGGREGRGRGGRDGGRGGGTEGRAARVNYQLSPQAQALNNALRSSIRSPAAIVRAAIVLLNSDDPDGPTMCVSLLTDPQIVWHGFQPIRSILRATADPSVPLGSAVFLNALTSKAAYLGTAMSGILITARNEAGSVAESLARLVLAPDAESLARIQTALRGLGLTQPIDQILRDVINFFEVVFRSSLDLDPADIAAVNSHLPSFCNALDSGTGALAASLSAPLRDGLAQHLRRLEALLRLRGEPEDRRKRLEQGEARERRRLAAAQGRGVMPSEDEFPGDLRPDGPRHTNDRKDFRDIRVAPTEDELLCLEAPYLPPNTPLGSPHCAEDKVEAYVDMTFRLTREEMVSNLRSGVQFLASAGLANVSRGADRMEIRAGNAGQSQGTLWLYRGVSIAENINDGAVQTHPRKGVLLKLMMNEIPLNANKKDGQRIAFWEASGRLKTGTLACLYFDVEDRTVLGGKRACLEVVTIEERRPLPAVDKKTNTTRDGPLKVVLTAKPIGNTFLSSSALTELLQGGSRHAEVLLVQADGGSFFAYEPVLSSLKQVRLPAWFLKYVGEVDARAATFEAPAYLCAGGPIDLAGSLKPCAAYYALPPAEQMLIRSRISAVDPQEPSRFPLEAVETFAGLDPSQSLSLKHILTRDMSLIQGPPGTGKTYIGGIAARLLVDLLDRDRKTNRSERSPILVLCYTNHALDQFLEHLMDLGVKEIVRVGGKSKSPLMESRNLFNLREKKPMSQASRGQVARLFQEKDDLVRQIESLLRNRQSGWMDPRGATSYIFLKDVIAARAPHMVPIFDNAGKAARKDDSDSDEEGAEFIEVVNKKEKNLWRVWTDGNSPRKAPPPRKSGSTLARPIEELLADRDIWSMSLVERRALLRYLVETKVSANVRQLTFLNSQLAGVTKELDEIHSKNDLAVLASAQVVGLTTTAASKYQPLLSSLGAKVIMVEEAGEVLEAHILAALSPRLEHLIQIGDHEQLRPKIEMYRLTKDSGKGFDLDVSMLERVVTSGVQIPFVTLSTQWRMTPIVSDLIRAPIYPDLRDAPKVSTYPPVPGLPHRVFFMSHTEKENSDAQQETKSKTNAYEAEFAVALARYLILQGEFKDQEITILAPYLGQVALIKRILGATAFLGERDREDLDRLGVDVQELEGEGAEGAGPSTAVPSRAMVRQALASKVRVSSVDNFQGEESRVVILTTTRSNAESKLGFVAIRNRINVMLSRAKHGMIIIGNSKCLVTGSEIKRAGGRPQMGPAAIWPEVVANLTQRGLVGDALPICCKNHPDTVQMVASAEELRAKAPEGGCGLPCSMRMPCGHACALLCHPHDPGHVNIHCPRPCDRLLPACRHPCPKLCGDACPDRCMQVLEAPLTLSCGHVRANPRCFEAQAPGGVKCTAKVEVTMPGCGHRVSVPCSDAAAFVEVPTNCPMDCGKTLPRCAHPCPNRCGACPGGPFFSLLSERDKAAMLKTPENPKLKATVGHHGPCQIVCDKPKQSCPHECGLLCLEHTWAADAPAGTPGSCPAACSMPCLVQCSHTRCSKSCAEPCAPCAEPCDWTGCPHQPGGCAFPCGAPCSRLPCNRRCERPLECGHQCPGLCGEPCPRAAVCKVCDRMSRALRERPVIDLMFGTGATTAYGDYDVDEDGPLLFLSCECIATVGFMDGWMRDQMSAVYEVKGEDEYGALVFSALRPFPQTIDQRGKGCPSCRKPSLFQVRRYARVMNKVLLDNAQLKFIRLMKARMAKLETELIESESAAAAATPVTSARETKIRSLHVKVTELKMSVRSSPLGRIYEGINRSIRTGKISGPQPAAAESESQLLDRVDEIYAPPPPDRSSEFEIGLMESRVLYLEAKILLAKAEGRQLGLGPSAGLDHQKAELAKGFTRARSRVQEAINCAAKVVQEAAQSSSPRLTVHATALFVRANLLKIRGTFAPYRYAVRSLLGNSDEAAASVADRLKREVAEQERIIRALETESEYGHVVSQPLFAGLLAALRKEAQQTRLDMDEQDRAEEMRAVISAFYQANSDIRLDPGGWGGEGRAFTCPNGHIYFIGGCGVAMETSRCIECGAAIGAGSHTRRSDNRPATEFLRSLGLGPGSVPQRG